MTANNTQERPTCGKLHCVHVILLQWNPDFSSPRFPDPPDISNQTLFPLDLLHSSSTDSTPDFSNPRFLETPDNSNQFWLPWVKLTLDNSNLRKFPNHLVRISITFTSLNKLALSDKLFPSILITQQAGYKSVISLEGKMTASDCQHSLNWAMQSSCLAHSAFLQMKGTSIDCAKVPGTFLKS